MGENESQSIEEARKELEENETAGDEKIRTLEDEVKEARRLLEENQTKLTEAERKHVVVQRDIERTSNKAESLEKRVQVLEDTITDATDSLKEERNAEELILLEGQYKEAEVRAESAERTCNVLERNIQETETEIEDWERKTAELEDEINAMNEMADI